MFRHLESGGGPDFSYLPPPYQEDPGRRRAQSGTLVISETCSRGSTFHGRHRAQRTQPTARPGGRPHHHAGDGTAGRGPAGDGGRRGSERGDRGGFRRGGRGGFRRGGCG
ncbi:MAG: hypothetical protein FJ128_13125 [Deltaproteobacteria bacterium]|nr:hypothetical protein [Deltaproteobacteria bacterium]